MKHVEVPLALIEGMHGAAERAYPEECCGFLLAEAASLDEPAVRRLVDIDPVENQSTSDRERRFVIPPDVLRAAEARAARRERVVAGFYHSHPDHPALPSQFDQDHAWPWYVYLILSTRAGGQVDRIGAFELDGDRGEFHELALRTVGENARDPPPTLAPMSRER